MKNALTMHPRFVRYLGTCFNPTKLEAYIITDYVVGSTLEVSEIEFFSRQKSG
jgi:hypothetical protein